MPEEGKIPRALPRKESPCLEGNKMRLTQTQKSSVIRHQATVLLQIPLTPHRMTGLETQISFPSPVQQFHGQGTSMLTPLTCKIDVHCFALSFAFIIIIFFGSDQYNLILASSAGTPTLKRHLEK